MAGEVLLTWERFVTQPVFKRYAKYAREPAALFECIGEDLASSNQEVREIAYWALVYAMPKLASILYAWETRQPGWRDRKGKDQHMINQGADIVSYLHRKLVIEHRFEIRGENGKDPRPFLYQEIKNKRIDEWRKRKKEVLLDYDAILTIPDPARSLEDSIIEKDAYEEWKKEFRTHLRSNDELEWFITVHLDEIPLVEVLKSNGIDPDSEPTVRQHFSRARKQMVADRDALLSFLLIAGPSFPLAGKFPRFPKNPEMSETGINRAIESVLPGAWLNGQSADGKNAIVVRPLTRGLQDVPAHIYLVAIHKQYIHKLRCDTQPHSYERKRLTQIRTNLLALDQQRCFMYVVSLINPKSRKLQLSRYMYNHHRAYPTEHPRLNAALAEVRDDYFTWLISNSIPDTHRVYQWRYGEPEAEIFLRKCNERGAKLPKLWDWRLYL